MAINRKKEETKEQKAQKEDQVFDVEVLKAVECKNGNIMINLKVNGVYINACFYKEVEAKKGEHKGEKIPVIQFPQKKNGDKYYNECSFYVSEETMSSIEKQIEDML